jgi:YihY family inner membrane protein
MKMKPKGDFEGNVMLRKRIQPWLDWIKHVVTEPRDELNRWQYAVRFAYELGIHGWRALNRDDAPQMAAALSFRTLFAMLPVIIVVAVLINAMQGPQQFQNIMDYVVEAMGLNNVNVVVPRAVQDVDEPSTVGLGQWLKDSVAKIAHLNLAALGWIGLALVVYSAISLMVTIENSFNKIYGAPEGRAWSRRVLVYWAVLTLGPLFIGITIFLDNRFGEIIAGMGTWTWLLTPIKVLWGFCVAWLLIFAVYTQLPNTRVNVKAALAGAFIAAIFLQTGKSLLGAYFGTAVSLGNIYGTLGTVPIFMFWLYLMWLVVLFGLEVSATVQRVQGGDLEELQELEAKRPQNGLVDPAAVLAVMEIVTERFLQSKSASTREIADETLIAESIVKQIIDRMHREGFLHRLDREDGAVSLARPPEQIPADRLIEIGYCLVDEGGVGRQSSLVIRLREAQKRLAQTTTLAGLIHINGQPTGPTQAATA